MTSQQASMVTCIEFGRVMTGFAAQTQIAGGQTPWAARQSGLATYGRVGLR